MSLEFAIIPSSKNYEDYANNVENIMRQNIKHNVVIDIDKDYNETLNSRINNWKKKEYHIINLDEEYTENNILSVIFYDDNSKSEKMSILDFVDIIASFEDVNVDEDVEDEDKDNNEEHKIENGGCIIS